MRFASDHIVVLDRLSCRLSIAILLSAFALGAQAQNKCSATGLMEGEKFAANNCAVALYEHSVAIWFNENPISAPEAESFQTSAHADETTDGKQRTLVQIMFCPGGGATTASATAVKSIDLNTNHAKSPVRGELPVKRQLVSGRDRGSAAAKRDDQARHEEVSVRGHVARVSCHRASGVRDTRCNNRQIRPASVPGPRRSRKKRGQGTRAGLFRSTARRRGVKPERMEPT